MFYNHYKEVDLKYWNYKYFKPKEIASKGDGSLLVNIDALTRLDILRELIGKPLYITSGYRDPLHNARVGGVPYSMHKFGKAFDISIKNVDKFKLESLARLVGFTGFGYYQTFLHVDTGRPRWWGIKARKKYWNYKN